MDDAMAIRARVPRAVPGIGEVKLSSQPVKRINGHHMKAAPQSAGTAGAKGPSAVRPTPKPLNRLSVFKQELSRLPRDVNLPDKTPKLTQQLVAQVEMLHRALSGLSDILVDEIGGLRADVGRWRSDRDGWLSGMRSVRQEVNDKLLQVEQEQARALMEVRGAKADLQGCVGRSVDQLDARTRALDRQLLDTRCEVQVLRNQVADMQVLTSSDFPAAVVRQRLQDKAAIQAQMEEVARDIAPAAIRQAVQQEVPGAVREQVLSVMKEVVENRVEVFRRQVMDQTSAAATGLERLSVDVAQMAGALQSTQDRCRALESSWSGSEQKLAFLAAQEDSNPRSSVRELTERLETASAQQARYAESMEEVVRALVEDTSQLARQAQAHDHALQRQHQHLADTREAVLRCSTVFSQVLKIPPPIPTRALSAPLSPLSPNLTINLADHLHAGGPSAGPLPKPAGQPAGKGRGGRSRPPEPWHPEMLGDASSRAAAWDGPGAGAGGGMGGDFVAKGGAGRQPQQGGVSGGRQSSRPGSAGRRGQGGGEGKSSAVFLDWGEESEEGEFGDDSLRELMRGMQLGPA